jgi:ribosomal-protein-alanine N-acetyltransferase
MSDADIPQVADIERESFPSMWPQTAYRRELQNKAARYLVLTEASDETAEASPGGLWTAIRRIVSSDEPAAPPEYLLGFIGMWLMVGEAHIVTFAVRESCRRRGIGERLLIACMQMAMDYDQDVVTLEVRQSNVGAQQLYEKYGLAQAGTRVRYYTDNNEDAVIMTTPRLSDAVYRARFEELRRQHQALHPDLWI